ncbi:MAG: 30S ribosomal protein S6 [Pseudomonadota bacterium]
MREYELVYVAQPQFTQGQIDQLNNRLKTMIEKDQGHLFYARSLGKRSLAYRIKKQTKGIYYTLCYAAQGGCNAEIERFLRYDENVLRFLTVLKNEKVDVQVRAAEIEARGEALSETREDTIENDVILAAKEAEETSAEEETIEEINASGKDN